MSRPKNRPPGPRRKTSTDTAPPQPVSAWSTWRRQRCGEWVSKRHLRRSARRQS